jgi:hypothetical protein
MSGNGQKTHIVRKRGDTMSEKKDRRSERTRQMLSDALVE